MDAPQVNQAFADIERFRHMQCRVCTSNQTVPLIAFGAVLVSCESCGSATRVSVRPA